MPTLTALLQQIEDYLQYHEKANPTVSKSTVGWQLDHSLLVIIGIVNQLEQSNPENYQWRPNWKRTYIQLRNSIPRGKAKAPKLVRPLETASLDDLQSKLAAAKEKTALLQSLPANSYFTHPYFGDLNLKSAIWFLKLHTNHHLKIVNDILNKG
ncbi:DinB family protein [Flavobacterium sp.]|uniref:DinB family protein n=1 Tax=Flavobacterium sp. TaxID=239 RepID=UPI002FDD1633